MTSCSLGSPRDLKKGSSKTISEWTDSPSGLPQAASSAAFFECELDTAVAAGTHSIFIGRVTKAVAADETPLAYANREYRVPVGLAAANAATLGTKTVLEGHRA